MRPAHARTASDRRPPTVAADDADRRFDDPTYGEEACTQPDVGDDGPKAA